MTCIVFFNTLDKNYQALFIVLWIKPKPLTASVLEKLFREYFRPLTYFALQYVKNQAEAEDIVQDLFIALYEKKDSVHIHLSEFNYLYTSVRNRCLKYLEHQNVKERRDAVIQEKLDSAPADPLELIAVIEFEHKYVRVLECLSPKCREVFEMSRMDGKKNQEIAVELNLSKRTVETHISQALKVIRKKLAKYVNMKT